MNTENSSLREVVRFADIEALSRDGAYRVCALAACSARAKRPFTVALTGGSSPGTLYRLLSKPPLRETIDWDNTHLFFGDERCVPPDAAESNYRQAREMLIDRAPISTANVHRMRGELPDHEQAARDYEAELIAFFNLQPGQPPRFDLVLLGMGPDGHCASLFPYKPALQERQRLVVATEPGLTPFVPRITLTLPVLNRAAEVMFLVPDGAKAGILARILEGPDDPDELPSQNVRPSAGTVTWLITNAAAAQLMRV
jgi:6-phosphogluconolactonase